MKKKILSKEKVNTVQQGFLFIIGIVLLFVLSQINKPVMMYENKYGNYFLFLMTSFLGIYMVIQIARLLEKSVLLEEMGKLSIAIYVWNFLIIGLFNRILNNLMGFAGISDEGILAGITFGFSLPFIYIIAKITYDKLPYIYGIKCTF